VLLDSRWSGYKARHITIVHICDDVLQLTTPEAGSCIQWDTHLNTPTAKSAAKLHAQAASQWRSYEARRFAHLMSATPMPAMMDTSLTVGSCA
jgi:hypothetical protein